MRTGTKLLHAALVLTTLVLSGEKMMAQKHALDDAKTIMLVHGAFADGSSWSKVIPLLQAKGLRVVSVAIPLTSFEEDTAAVKRALAAEHGPVVLVGHSYGGVVVTETGNDPKVTALVYVAAFAPDAGQSITDISAGFPKPLGMTKLVPQPDGFLLLSPEGIDQAFAQDLSESEKKLLVAVQPQTAGSIFAAKPTEAAWHHKPTFYIVAEHDNMIAPEQEKSMASQMQASTTTLVSSHVVMLSHPREVAQVIENAARRTK